MPGMVSSHLGHSREEYTESWWSFHHEGEPSVTYRLTQCQSDFLTSLFTHRTKKKARVVLKHVLACLAGMKTTEN